MAKFIVLSRKDAFVDYTTEVEAETAEEAVELVYDGDGAFVWEARGTVEFDARHVVALDAEGAEIDSTARGDFS